MTPSFQPLGAAHLSALATILFACAALARIARRNGFERTRGLRLALAVIAIAAWGAENVVAEIEGWLDWQIGLPLQLCDVALALAVASLVSPEARWVEPLYFFGFAGTIPALVWPDLAEGFPSFRFVIYFLPHGLVVVTAWAMIVGFGVVPRAGAWRRALFLLNLYAFAITSLNLWLGTNFLYLRAKPPTATPFDWFGPWPYYLVVLEALAVVLFWLLDRPFAASRRRKEAESREALALRPSNEA